MEKKNEPVEVRDPEVSVVIPIYNEEPILVSSVEALLHGLDDIGRPYEVILAENGSTDRTVLLCEELCARHPQVRYLHGAEPNYGLALREGIRRARGQIVVCDEIDLCDLDFYRRALDRLDRGEADMVIGSKVMKGASDDRPFLRHLATLVINGMLRAAVGFHGTDTHGLKAFRRRVLMPVLERCVIDRDLFASEFVIRAERDEIAIAEIPIQVREKRRPSIDLLRRVPNTLRNMVRLVAAVRFDRG